MDCKATVNIGDYSRGGRTRGDNQALDHDMGCEEKYPPFGGVDEDSGQLPLAFGRSAKTRDFIMDCLYGWWERLPLEERNDCSRLQIKVDNGPESSGRRTQFLKRRVEFTDSIGKPIQLLYYPPPLTANTIRGSDAEVSKHGVSKHGAFWKSPGMAPSEWMWTRGSNGPRA
jgi:hypothetical protein